MQIEPLEVYASDSNYAIIKPPGRNYPGCVIQGDSLAILCRTALRIAKAVQSGQAAGEDFLGDVEELNNALVERLLHYQSVLTAHKIQFPHAWPMSEQDLVKLLPEDSEAE